MAFEDWVERIWEQISLLDAEQEMLELELDRLRRIQEGEGREAKLLTRQLEDITERLFRLDGEYAALLRGQKWQE